MFIRCIAWLLVGLTLFSFIAIALTGCSKQEPPVDSSITQGPVQQEVYHGDVFLQSGFKIKAVLTPQAVSTLDPLTFEVYVDAKGNGNGLVGYKDGVYDVIITNDKVYITVGSNTVINLTTLTGHMIPSSVVLNGVSDLKSLGFTLHNDTVIAYKASIEDVIYDVTYSPSDTTFESTTVAAGNAMALNDVISYILDYEANLHVTSTDTPEEVVKESFYNKADEGVKIHDVIYSISDYCNPDTYFESIQPSSLVPEYAWNKDDKVEFLHITYISSDGQTEFVTTEGYVQTIRTTAVFNFMGLTSGMTYDEVAAILGVKLKKQEMETFKPLREGMIAVKSKSSSGSIEVSYKDLSILFGFNKEKKLSSLSITNYIDFVEEA